MSESMSGNYRWQNCLRAVKSRQKSLTSAIGGHNTMKSLAIIFAIVIFSINAFAQTQSVVNDPSLIFDPCYAGRNQAGENLWKPVRVGVEINASGFNNRVEAEIFSAAAMNIQLKEPSVDYCLVPSVEGSERELDVRTSIKILDRERGADEFKTEAIRTGIKIGAPVILEAIFGKKNARKIQKTAKDFGGKYTNDPKITVYTIQVTAETTMRSNGKILWEGSSSRVFLVKKTVYPKNVVPTTNEIFSLDPAFDISKEIAQLSSLYKIKDLPDFRNVGPRGEQILKLFAAKEALMKENIRLAQQNSEMQRTTGGGN
jgi:hypothetical protein